MIRLLVCRDCRTIEELPGYDGPVEYDVLLDTAVERHIFPNGERHIGNLMTVEDRVWSDPSAKAEIVKRIAEKTTGLNSEFYATKNTYEEDALGCYSRHGRPTDGCSEYHDERKRIGNPTKELAANWHNHPFKVYLCDFCPVKSWVLTQERYKAGLYRES